MSGTYEQKSGDSGNKTFVDERKRAYSFSTIETENEHETGRGKSWNIATLDITLTQTTATLYAKNTGVNDIVVHVTGGIASYSANATGATDNILFEIIRNPTTGTLISGNTALPVFNRNFGKETPIPMTVLIGADGETITDGDVIASARHNPASRLALTIPFIMPQGSSIAFRVTEPTGNTSMKYNTFIQLSERNNIGPSAE